MPICNSRRSANKIKKIDNETTFDTLVIGGGSAGCVIASRLSEDPDHSVCLIEAGSQDNDWRIKIPLGLTQLIGNPKFDWCYRSAAHEHLGGHQVSVPRGRMLGGSGSINSMVYIRGRPSDYDDWASEGCVGWDWNSVLPVFKRAENNRQLGDDSLHGSQGPLQVSDLPSPHTMVGKLVAAGNAQGIPFNRDFNGTAQEGIGPYQTTMHNGIRCSAADAYLRPALSRSNLAVLTETLADRIEFENGRAIGVRVLRDGETLMLRARRNVVLCAGAIGSPAILLRSGVGPGRDLQELGIGVERDMPRVGGNLHDHPAVGIFYGGGNDGYALSFRTLPQNLLAPFRFLFSRNGPFASNTVEGGGFARTRPELDEPDVQFHFIPARIGHEGSMWVWGRGYYCDACVLKPKSRGKLTLASSDPNESPVIDLNLLSDPADQQTLLAGVKLVRRILADKHLAQGNAHELVPGPSVITDDDLDSFIKSRLGTAYHPVGTCRMGPADDSRSVVDPDLRLIGFENVVVADASVMPEIVAGNTNAPTMMIAEVAADKLSAQPD